MAIAEAIRRRDPSKPGKPYIEGRPTAMRFEGLTYTLRDLPQPGVVRWVTRRKALVLGAVDAGLLTETEVFDRYGITHTELDVWRSKANEGGRAALRETRIQDYEVRAPLPTAEATNIPTSEESSLPPTEEPSQQEETEATQHELSVEPATNLVCYQSHSLGHFTGTEVKLLELLLSKVGVTVSRTEMLTYLYQGKKEPELKIIDVFMCKLRKKLRTMTGAEWVETTWGRGYKLLASPSTLLSTPSTTVAA